MQLQGGKISLLCNIILTLLKAIFGELQLQNLDIDVHYAIPLILRAFENFHNDVILLDILSLQICLYT